MKLKNYLYVFLIFIFAVLSYVLFDSAINTKTKKVVTCNENSSVLYKVHLFDNDYFNQEYLNMGDRYIASLVDDIVVNFNYKSVFDKEINGYYSYDVIANLVIYQNETNDILLSNKYNLINNKTVVLDKNSNNTIDIVDNVTIDYNKYKEELTKFSKKFNVDASGYLEVIFELDENFDFKGFNDVTTDERTVALNIPLSLDTFRISVLNDSENNIINYSDFSTKERVNYLFIVIGAFMLSLSISFLILLIRNLYKLFSKHNNYHYELNKILKEYDDIIVNVKKFYNKKKYNLIYVDSFKDILDIYNKTGDPISFKEIKKDFESMFLIIDDDNAWIYRMINDNK